jgi:hypothetical protein
MDGRQVDQRPTGAVRVAVAEEDPGGLAEEPAGLGKVGLVFAPNRYRIGTWRVLKESL